MKFDCLDNISLKLKKRYVITFNNVINGQKKRRGLEGEVLVFCVLWQPIVIKYIQNISDL